MFSYSQPRLARRQELPSRFKTVNVRAGLMRRKTPLSQNFSINIQSRWDCPVRDNILVKEDNKCGLVPQGRNRDIPILPHIKALAPTKIIFMHQDTCPTGRRALANKDV
jgi:hypothetical protein